MTRHTNAAPLTDYVVTLLLAGPAAVGSIPPRDAATRAELARCWGRHGERCGATWNEHHVWLRAQATTRGIRPVWPRNRFFAEALTAGWKGTR